MNLFELLGCWVVGLLGCWVVGLLGCWVVLKVSNQSLHGSRRRKFSLFCLRLVRLPRDLDVKPLICLYSYIRMMPVVTSVCGAQFVTVTLTGLMSAFILMSEWCQL